MSLFDYRPFFLVALNIQNVIQDRAEYSERTAFIIAILIVADIAFLILAVRPILVSTLESLLEIILILAAINAARVTVCSRTIDAVIRPIAASSAAVIGASGRETLTIAFVNGLSEHVGSVIVRIVVSAVAVDPIATGSNIDRRLNVIIGAADHACVACRYDARIAPGPFGLSLLLRPCSFFVGFLLMLIGLAVLFVSVPIVLTICRRACSQ